MFFCDMFIRLRGNEGSGNINSNELELNLANETREQFAILHDTVSENSGNTSYIEHFLTAFSGENRKRIQALYHFFI